LLLVRQDVRALGGDGVRGTSVCEATGS
jgi:hypothetical protein